MNEYGKRARQNWECLAPRALEKLLQAEPDYFQKLGERAQEEVEILQLSLAGPDLPEETYFQKVGRLNMAKMQAEEVVNHNLLTPPEDSWEVQDEDEESPHPEMTRFLEMLRENDRDWREMEEQEEIRFMEEQEEIIRQKREEMLRLMQQ